MYCPNCGTEVKAQSNFCHNCRKNLKSAVRENESSYHRPENPAPADTYRGGRARGESGNESNKFITYLKQSVLNPLYVFGEERFNFPLIPLLIVLAGIVVNTLLSISSLKSILLRLVAGIIEGLSLPEITSGNEHVDEMIRDFINDYDVLPEWASMEYQVDALIAYINPVLISLMLMIFFVMIMAYNLFFLYVLPKVKISLSKVVTDYLTIMIVPMILTTIALLIINFGLVIIGMVIVMFALILAVYLTIYQLTYYKKIEGTRVDIIYTLILYITGVMIIYLLVLHSLLIRTYNLLVEQISILMDHILTLF